MRITAGEAKAPTPEVAALAERSRWAAKIARGDFVASVEIVPPRGVDATRMLSRCAPTRKRLQASTQ